MNDLSKLLYFADLSPSISTVLGWFVFFSILFLIASGIFFGVQMETIWDRTKRLETRKKAATKWDTDGVPPEDLDAYIDELKADTKKAVFGVKLRTALGLIVGMLFWVGAVALPSRETVLAIAASEMGERALQTPTATKAFKALDAWLDKQIAPATEASQ